MFHIDDSAIRSKVKIAFDRQSDIINFVNIATNCDDDTVLYIIDDSGTMCISARSLLGCMYAREFDNMWLVSNNDKIYTIFNKFIIS